MAESHAWHHAKQRCENPNDKDFASYGGRGIKLCERWQIPDNFLADMGEKPTPKDLYSLDRINNEGDYEPGNCRWATILVQNRNRRPARKR
jgi:hypothetical protein